MHGDGIWLDGIGPDNGAYMCSGVCCGFGQDNSPLVQAEIDLHCQAQADATTQVRVQIIRHFKTCMTEIYLHSVARMAD